MALDKSTDGLKEISSNGITAYIDTKLIDSLKQFGDINIDYVTNQEGQSGYSIQVGNNNCDGCSCS